MALVQRLELRQGQQLVMTPQLQQAIRLLQLSNLELNAFVDAEIERNPLLEREEEAAPEPGVTEADPPAASDDPIDASATAAGAAVTDAGGPESSHELQDGAEPADARSDEFDPWPHPDRAAPSASRLQSAAGEPNPEAFVASPVSLRDHLLRQASLIFVSPVERLIAEHLIDLVDESGYIKVDLEELAERLGAPPSLTARVLAQCQTLEPSGVFARSLSECLVLQLKEQNRFDPQIARLLDNLHFLATHDFAALKRAVGVETPELAEMIAEIKGLDPKPGLRFGSAPVQPIVPDVLVRQSRQGAWIIELNNDTLPRVLVNRRYYAQVANARPGGSRDKTYLMDCLQTANWLVKSLDQRARTILRVSEEIVRQQDAFFLHGVGHLRPLNLKTVADAISMHESTVSRVTSNKYMTTPRGIFELKYFFTSSIASASDGEAHSSEAVRHRIKRLIAAETVRNVLSDDKIVDCLKGDGIDIARRTVAKYREVMRIPSSVQRRREKRMADRGARPD